MDLVKEFNELVIITSYLKYLYKVLKARILFEWKNSIFYLFKI